ncbi:hypothetical protein [Criblamydia sequanensis]|uniref:Uncharacterized protein n=1 Tax=Candidatus Criblamydia sequanensis CRIB-18 TaxID=1437425 RepID=A0A090DX45_9BACT|nr:hypothetical protein [Criblamydia sequanensis]CDR33404.1 hypothetical protein CSEC_0571 [Criblamydia sequanensis CRIB-18]
MNSICNFIGQSFGLCPLPSLVQISSVPRDREDPLNREIAEFLDYHTPLDVDRFWDNTLGNEKIFYQLIRLVEWNLAEKFYKANPYVNLRYTEDSPCSSCLSKLMDGLIGIMRDNPWYSEKGDLHKLINLIFETDPTLDLYLEMSFPHKRVLEFLFYNNHIELINKLIENLMREGSDDERILAKKIFISIRDLIEKNKELDGRPPDEQAVIMEEKGLCVWVFPEKSARENGLKLWNTFLSLIKEAYPEVFSEIEFSNPTLDLSAEAINTLVSRLWLPIEIYEKIACKTISEEFPLGLRKLLSPKFNLEPKVSKETLIKLTTLSFLAFQENSKVMLDNQQKKQCFHLIEGAILKNGSIFNADLKERIVREIGGLDQFSKSNIKKALERAFN